MFKKNDICKASVVDIGQNGEGIGKSDGFTFFIEGALPEEEVLIKVLKVKKNLGYGKILKVTQASPIRTEAICSLFDKCGGCHIMNMKYEAQLFYKEKKVKDSLVRIGGFDALSIDDKLMPIIGMDEPFYYRNKVQIPVREENGQLKVGFYAKNSHRIVSMEDCKIQPVISKEIIDIVINYMKAHNVKGYNEESHKGIIRHILIKYGFRTEQIMVCIVTNLPAGKVLINESTLVKMLKKIKNIASISINYNNEKTNVILGNYTRNIYGKPYIEDYIGDIAFKISPLSFYQVNAAQVQLLYDQVVEFCELDGSQVVIDAYCGIGSIALYIAKYAKKVIGIEVVEEAVSDALMNAQNNKINNVEFILGSAEEKMTELENDRNIKPDIIIVDPPRKGCERKMLDAIIKAGPEKIIYVSCNPDTLARDLKILCEMSYQIEKVQSIDMFPHTTHVETVALLSRKIKGFQR